MSQTDAVPVEPQLDTMAKLGGWLFQRRTWLPLPIAATLLALPKARLSVSTPGLWLGMPLIVAGELLRLWGVRHIGAVSRTRSDRLGPLVASGPFSRVRNPLYVGNILLWAGFTVSAELLPCLVPVVALLAFEYHAIVRWEERLLTRRLGTPYVVYMERVPRWLPGLRPAQGTGTATFSWRQTLYSERGTLMAIAAGYLLLAIKAGLSN